jgi:prevent-host-death family protein
VFVHDSNHKGNVAEAAIAAAAIKLGVDVIKPLVEHTRYDLIFDLRPRLLRVQCKWAPRRGDVVVVSLVGFRFTSHGQVRSVYGADEIDAVAAYCQELEQCYLLPIELVAEMRGLHLRLAPPKNAQRAGLHWARDHLLSGAVAQLGRASEWHSEGRGFESHQLHSDPIENSGVQEVGAHQFRNHFGWYMERAVAGEEFLVTRRGKPCVRLIPAHAQLPIAG